MSTGQSHPGSRGCHGVLTLVRSSSSMARTAETSKAGTGVMLCIWADGADNKAACAEYRRTSGTPASGTARKEVGADLAVAIRSWLLSGAINAPGGRILRCPLDRLGGTCTLKISGSLRQCDQEDR